MNCNCIQLYTIIYNENSEFWKDGYDLEGNHKCRIQYLPLTLLFSQGALTFPKTHRDSQIDNQKEMEELRASLLPSKIQILEQVALCLKFKVKNKNNNNQKKKCERGEEELRRSGV